jgi:hypothetical protein
MAACALHYLAKLVADGKRVDKGFKNSHYNQCAKVVNERFHVNFSGSQIPSDYGPSDYGNCVRYGLVIMELLSCSQLDSHSQTKQNTSIVYSPNQTGCRFNTFSKPNKVPVQYIL